MLSIIYLFLLFLLYFSMLWLGLHRFITFPSVRPWAAECATQRIAEQSGSDCDVLIRGLTVPLLGSTLAFFPPYIQACKWFSTADTGQPGKHILCSLHIFISFCLGNFCYCWSTSRSGSDSSSPSVGYHTEVLAFWLLWCCPCVCALFGWFLSEDQW